MNIYSENLNLDTTENFEIFNLTPRIEAVISASGIKNGIATISSMHTTTALFVNEFEERLVEDIKKFLQKLIPSDKQYLHNDIHLRDCPPEEPENAHSHLMAMFLNNSEVIPVVDGNLTTGQWQSVMFAELDGPRSRTIQVQVFGDKN